MGEYMAKTINPAAMSATDIASAFSVTRQAVGAWAKRDGCPRLPDGRFSLQAVIAWRLARLASDESELLASAGDSPSLERWRAAKAELAELEVAQRRNQLVDRAQLRAGLSRMAALIREAGQQIQREHGAGANSPLEEALEAFANEGANL